MQKMFKDCKAGELFWKGYFANKAPRFHYTVKKRCLEVGWQTLCTTKVLEQVMDFDDGIDYMSYKRYKLFNVQINTTKNTLINQNKISKFSNINQRFKIR